MKDCLRLIYGILMAAAIYFIALMLIPQFSFFNSSKETYSWFGTGEITQISFLIISLILIAVLGKGNFSEYGLKSTKFKEIIKPIPISAAVALLVIILNIMMMMMISKPENPGEHPGMDKNLLETFLTVWILASICEEIFYRGLILSFLSPLKKHGIMLFKKYLSIPVIISGLLFGIGHLCLLGKMNPVIVVNIVISASLLGLIAGYYREKSGSLLPAIVSHITFNVIGTMIPFILTSFVPE